MMKHVGKQASTGDKLILLFREVPGDPDYCLVVKSKHLQERDHDVIMNILEGDEGQQSNNLAEVLHHQMNSAGRPILAWLHQSGKIVKLPASDVYLTPNARTQVLLSEVNNQMRNQNNIEKTTSSDVLSDDDLAEQLLSQANTFETEAQRLREEAYELNPALKPVTTKTTKKTTRKKATVKEN